MIIKKGQLEKFSLHLEDSFIQMTREFLGKHYPELHFLSDDQRITDFIKSGIAKADKYNIKKRMDVLFFIELLVRLGENFDKEPPKKSIFKVLNTTNFSGSEKISKLKQLTQ